MSNGEFTLKGGVEKKGSQWRAEIVLSTPDGKITKLDSGFMFSSEAEAESSLQATIDTILKDFTRHGTEVISRNGVNYQ